MNKTKVTRVTIPSSVTKFDECAFRYCNSLVSIAIPSSVGSIAKNAFADCALLATVAIPASIISIDARAFGASCSSLTTLLVQPADADAGTHLPPRRAANGSETVDANTGAGAGAGADAGEPQTEPQPKLSVEATAAIVTAFNHQHQFPKVTRVWATDDIVAQLDGAYALYESFAAVPRSLKAAPDAKTWAGVQLWLWWLPPSFFRGGSDDTRVVSESRTVAIWSTMMSAHRASKGNGKGFGVLPDLEPELWEQIFAFLKHDQPPTHMD